MIKKQEFYEGAALHQIIRGGEGHNLQYKAPFFVADNRIHIYLKYSTGVRSPWGFTFTPDEQTSLYKSSSRKFIVLGLICGDDGVVSLPFFKYREIASKRDSAVHVACYRKKHEHYEVSGPDTALIGKIPPSDWLKLLITEF